MPGLIRSQSIIHLSGGGGGFVNPLPPYFNSHEPRDSNTLFADDFTRASGGAWYRCDADHLGVGGCADGAGWFGTIYGPGGNGGGSPNPPCYGPPNGSANQEVTFGPSIYAAQHLVNDGSIGGTTMADHFLINGADSETEIWLRWYQRFSIGYQFSGEKCFTINRGIRGGGGAGIDFGDVHFNIGAGGLSSNGGLQWQPQIYDNNFSSGYNCTGNMHWNCIQLHIKLNTAGATPGTDGTIAFYADDCGLLGTSHPALPTLRAQRTNYQFPRTSASQKIGQIWKENWANNGTQGSIGYSDLKYIYCTRGGLIPFVESWP